MELEPVVHNNDSLNFKASGALTNVIAFIKGRLFSLLCSVWLVFFGGTVKLFVASGRAINPAFLISEAILTTVAVFVSYNLTSRISSVVVIMGRHISITNEIISLTTFTFHMSFWKKKPLNRIEFKIDELKIRKTDNPLMFTRAFDNRVFELRDKIKEAYIVFDYFDPLLKEKLTEILVEVTPPELLIPGRLRHY